MNTCDNLTASEKLAAHGAMRCVYNAWDPDKHSLFELCSRLNAAAARAVYHIKNARRD